MDTKEKEPLIKNFQDNDININKRSCRYCWQNRPKYIEVGLCLYYLAFQAFVPLVEQFVHAEIQKGHEKYKSYYDLIYLRLKPGDISDILKDEYTDVVSQSCNFNNKSVITNILDGKLEKSVQSKSSTWLMFIDLTLTIPAVFSTLIICSYGDISGRKLGLVLASIGGTLRSCIFILTIYLNLPNFMYLVASFIEGISGSSLTFFGSSCAYVADTSPAQRRAIRFIILQTLHILANACASLGIGYVIDIFGYHLSFFIILFTQIINTLYIIIGVPESKQNANVTVSPQPNTLRRNSSLQRLKAGAAALTKRTIGSFAVLAEETNQKCGRLKMGLLLASFLTTGIIAMGINAVQTLYMLAPPFCWTSVLIGYYNAISSLVHGVAGFIGMLVLTRWLKDESVAIIGSITNVLGRICFGIADKSLWLYVAIFASLMTNVVFPLTRAMMSKIISPRRQGALFATIFSLETIMDVVSGALMNAIYAATLNIHSGIVFFVGAVMYGICTILLCTYYIVGRITKQYLNPNYQQEDMINEVIIEDNDIKSNVPVTPSAPSSLNVTPSAPSFVLDNDYK